MKFRHWSNLDVKEMRLSEALEYEVSGQDSERGVIEDCEKKIELLTKLVGIMADHMPMPAQYALAKEFFFWKPVQ